MKKNWNEGIILLGATGSIGNQTIEVCVKEKIPVLGISFCKNVQRALEIINLVHPKYVHTNDEHSIKVLKEKKINPISGDDGLFEMIKSSKDVVNAVTGISGLVPTIMAIKNECNLYLANKESMVTCGEYINKLLKSYKAKIYPIDSEHNAIYRLINNEKCAENRINKIIITASGGSFREKTREELKDVTVKEALNHPNWQMGKKITIDSATMVNKGLEIIEAHYLFDLDYDRIETIIHKESIIHSMVEYNDGSVGAVMYNPSMIIPIQNALLQEYKETTVQKLDFNKLSVLSFEKMDSTRFPMIDVAYKVGRKKGLYPCVYNASNEEAVRLFLEGKISFLEIEKIIIWAINLFDESSLNKDYIDEKDVLNCDKIIKERIKKVYDK